VHIQRQFHIAYMCELDYKATSDADNNPSGDQTVIFAVLEA